MNAHRSTLLALSMALAMSTAVGCDQPAPVEDASAGSDAGPGCTTDAECDDGLFCNGVEACAAGRCAAGTMACGAGVACDEAGETCGTACSDPDADGDGHDAADCGGDDCDDTDADRFPGNPEVCDGGHDEDCDSDTFGFRDADGDGVASDQCCNADPGGGGDSTCGTDCDDATIARRPAQLEICDSVDNDCDGAVDEEMNDVPWYPDTDGDLFGDGSATPTESCTPIVGSSLLGTDCDDTRTSISPLATEGCNGVDDDCDEAIDEGCPGLDGGTSDGGTSGTCELPLAHPDTSDMFAAFNADPAGACELVDGGEGGGSTLPFEVFRAYIAAGEEGSPPAGPAVTASGLVSVTPATLRAGTRDAWMIEYDTDTMLIAQLPSAFGSDYASVTLRWAAATDTVTVSAFTRSPCSSRMAAEAATCDGVDQDCDGMVDEGVTYMLWTDLDGDGAGGGTPTTHTCGSAVGIGAVPVGGDCDDFDPARSPLLPELCGGADEDCDGTVDETAAANASCAAPFTTSSCVGGACVVSACTAPYDDCDLAGVNGCEADTDTSTLHCGACGSPCGDTCAGGTCMLTPVVDIAAGDGHACIVRTSGRVLCWGDNSAGQLGDGTTVDRTVPVAALGITDAVDVEAVGSATCAALSSGRVMCWGDQDALPEVSGTDRTRPGLVAEDLGAVAALIEDAAEIALGGGRACVRMREASAGAGGRVVCAPPRAMLGGVAGITDATDVAAGQAHACARRATGGVLCWGVNDNGQIGDGTMIERPLPRAVTGLADAVEVSVAGYTSCARRMGGTVVCWGYGDNGELGDGASASSSTFVTVTGVSGATGLSVGDGYSCAHAGTALRCWGQGGTQLPGVAGGPHPTSVAVPGAGSVAQVDAGGTQTNCVRRTDGTFACFGGAP